MNPHNTTIPGDNRGLGFFFDYRELFLDLVIPTIEDSLHTQISIYHISVSEAPDYYYRCFDFWNLCRYLLSVHPPISSHFDTDLECAIASMTFKSSIIWFFFKKELHTFSKIFTHLTIGLQAFIFHTAGIHMTIRTLMIYFISNLPIYASYYKWM